MSNLRILCQRYLQLDDQLVGIHHKIRENTGKAEYHILVREYICKYIEREDLKSGIRRLLINELCNGIGAEDD